MKFEVMSFEEQPGYWVAMTTGTVPNEPSRPWDQSFSGMYSKVSGLCSTGQSRQEALDALRAVLAARLARLPNAEVTTIEVGSLARLPGVEATTIEVEPLSPRSGTPVTDAFRAWVKSASPETLQAFADQWNGVATTLRAAHMTDDPEAEIVAICLDCGNRFPAESMRCTQCHSTKVTERREPK